MKEIKGKCNKVELARIHDIGNHCIFLYLIIIFYLYLYPDCFIYHFETYQDLSIGAVAVEYFTIKGSLFLAFANFLNSTFIYKFSDSTRKFFLYETLDTKNVWDIEYFTISDEHYLAVTNLFNTSVIYRWNGQLFTPFENIAAHAWEFSFFTVDKEPYLAVSSLISSISRCIIYKWKNNTFEKFQVIEGPCSIDAFIIDNETYFAQAGGLFVQRQSVVYKWSGESFSKLQTLPPASEIKFFNINEQVFLALGSQRANPNSYIYKWEGSQFILFQSISTNSSWVLCVHSFVMCGQMFLGFTDMDNDKSTLYRFSLDKFTKYQEISTFGATDMTSFEYKGYTYLAIANTRNSAQRSTKSTLYKWTTGM